MKLYGPGADCYLNVTCFGVNLASIKLMMISID